MMGVGSFFKAAPCSSLGVWSVQRMGLFIYYGITGSKWNCGKKQALGATGRTGIPGAPGFTGTTEHRGRQAVQKFWVPTASRDWLSVSDCRKQGATTGQPGAIGRPGIKGRW